MRSVHGNRTIDVTHEGDPNGVWDVERLGQALSNLLGNAIQYGDVATPITTTIDGKDSELVEISVHNLGSPISDEAKNTIFQSWTEVKSRVRDDILISGSACTSRG